MFLPDRSLVDEKEKRQKSYQQIEAYCSSLIESNEIKDACIISVQEVVCGDPQCAPIDTMITLSFPSYVSFHLPVLPLFGVTMHVQYFIFKKYLIIDPLLLSLRSYPSGGQGMFALPMEPQQVTLEILQENFPPDDILDKWMKGEDAEWPPMYDDDDDDNNMDAATASMELRSGAEKPSALAVMSRSIG